MKQPPPPHARRLVTNLLLVGGVLVALGLLWMGTQLLGPTGGVPPIDPLLAYLSQPVPPSGNAADSYAAALERFKAPSDENIYALPFLSAERVPDSAVRWVADNAEFFEHLDAASRRSVCVFPYQRQPDGELLFPFVSRMRESAKSVFLRAAIALDRGNLDEFLECLRITDVLAQHTERPHCAIPYLVGAGIQAQQLHAALWPLSRGALSEKDRRAYVRAARELLSPPPALADVIVRERDESCWRIYAMLNSLPMSLLRGRTIGEVRRAFEAAEALGRESVSARRDPASATRLRYIAEIRKPPLLGAAALLNLPAMFARRGPPVTEGLFRVDAWLTTEYRGRRTVLRLFAHRDEHGAFPGSLSELDDPDTIDPFTNAPFLYRLTSDGFTLYSAALDGDDDGGRHDPRFGLDPVPGRRSRMNLPTSFEPTPVDADYVIWPPQPTPVATTQPGSSPSSE